MSLQKVVAVVLAHNEAKVLSRTLRILNGFKEKKLIDSVVVVNDGSTDRTVTVAERYGARVVSHRENLGKRQGFVTGAKAVHKAGGTVMLVVDADLVVFPEKTLRKMVEAVAPGKKLMATAQQFEIAPNNLENGWPGRKVKHIFSNAQRAINMDCLRPLIVRNRKWVQAFDAGPRQSNSLKQIIARTFPSHLREILGNIKKMVDAGEITEEYAKAQIVKWRVWGLEYALERLVPKNKKTRLRAPVYTMPPFRKEGNRTKVGQRMARYMVDSYFWGRNDKAKKLRARRAKKRIK